MFSNFDIISAGISRGFVSPLMGLSFSDAATQLVLIFPGFPILLKAMTRFIREHAMREVENRILGAIKIKTTHRSLMPFGVLAHFTE